MQKLFDSHQLDVRSTLYATITKIRRLWCPASCHGQGDRTDFISRIAELARDDSMGVYAWALLPNHFHLLCKTLKRPVSLSMRRLLTGYVVNFNKRRKRHGHLFQNRYKSIVCQEDAYLKELVRYIHLNLIRAGLVKDIKDLNRSPWSGHSALMGNMERDWQDTEYVLSFFGKGRAARKNYLKICGKGNCSGKKTGAGRGWAYQEFRGVG